MLFPSSFENQIFRSVRKCIIKVSIEIRYLHILSICCVGPYFQGWQSMLNTYFYVVRIWTEVYKECVLLWLWQLTSAIVWITTHAILIASSSSHVMEAIQAISSHWRAIFHCISFFIFGIPQSLYSPILHSHFIVQKIYEYTNPVVRNTDEIFSISLE